MKQSRYSSAIDVTPRNVYAGIVTVASLREYYGPDLHLAVVAEVEGTLTLEVAVDDVPQLASRVQFVPDDPPLRSTYAFPRSLHGGWHHVEVPPGLHVVTLTATGTGTVRNSAIYMTNDPGVMPGMLFKRRFEMMLEEDE